MSEQPAMTLNEHQASILEKMTTYRFLLLFLVLMLVADLVLLTTAGHSLISVSWTQMRANPWQVALIALGYGASLTIGAGIASLAMRLLECGVFRFRCLIRIPPESISPGSGLVLRSVALEALESSSSPIALANFQEQVFKREREAADWHLGVSTAAVCLLLGVLSQCVDGALMSVLTTQHGSAPWILLCLINWPALYQLWAGEPGHDLIYWPKLARDLDAARAAQIGPAYNRHRRYHAGAGTD